MQNTMPEELVNPEIVESMGVSQPAYEEILQIIGKVPTVEQLCTLLAMWEANGKQQSLYSWLKCQPHTVEYHEYLYDGIDDRYKDIKEPKVKECISIATELTKTIITHNRTHFAGHGNLIYMVGDVSSIFLDSDYAHNYLHLASDPIPMDDVSEAKKYIQMILSVLGENEILSSNDEIGKGGLFMALVGACEGKCGFDILTCREVRLDAFLFGEEPGRFLISIPESQDDFFLQKMDEARINCCFLGRVTKGRVLVDDMDFGPISHFSQTIQ